MASKSSEDKALKRSYNSQNLLYSEILNSQQSDPNGNLGTVDTALICNGGTVRAHAFILASASSFFKMALASQGVDYPYIREIMIPGFSLKEIENMLEVSYKGHVYLSTNEEVKCLRETLKFFQVSNVHSNNGKFYKIKGSLKVSELNRIPQDIFRTADNEDVHEDGSPRVLLIETGSSSNSAKRPPASAKKSKPPVADIPTVRKSGRTRKPNKMYEPNVSDAKKREDEVVSRRPEMPINNLQFVVKVPRLIHNGRQKRNEHPTTAAMKPNTSVSGGSKKNDSGTDSEDADFKCIDYNDKEWLHHQTHLCQSCRKIHKNPQDASNCIKSLGVWRCYFCFGVYSTTEVLNEHFRKCHKQGGKEDTVICPFCDQTILYTSVSCHVVRKHWSEFSKKPKSLEKKEKEGNGQKVRPSTSTSAINRRPTDSRSVYGLRRRRSLTKSSKRIEPPPTSSPSPPGSTLNRKQGRKGKENHATFANMKKMMTIQDSSENAEPLKVPNFNFIVTKTMLDGKIMTFHLFKKR